LIDTVHLQIRQLRKLLSAERFFLNVPNILSQTVRTAEPVRVALVEPVVYLLGFNYFLIAYSRFFNPYVFLSAWPNQNGGLDSSHVHSVGFGANKRRMRQTKS
jgi:hypothetical protein